MPGICCCCVCAEAGFMPSMAKVEISITAKRVIEIAFLEVLNF
jgi:hypothetical protein